MKSVPGSIWTSNISGTNLLTIKASANDAEVAYNILRSALKNYPEVAQYVIGQTEITMIDDGGIPSDTGKTTVIHGSVRNGALVGLALGLAIVFIRAAVTRTIRNEDELRSAVNVNCLGTLPACFSKKHRNEETKREINILYDTNRSAYVESMRLIRTRIERALGENKVLMVTSSVAGEGKSTVAANIAISMALKGKRVILVDCDLRNPSVGRLFNLEGSYPGLRSVLDGTSSLDDALVEISDPKITAGLSLLPGADKETRSIEVLSTDRMGKLLTEMRELADVIVLDTPPSAVLVDAMMLVKHVDTIAYVVMCDYARRRNIVDGIEELNAGGAKIAGCILNGGGSHTGRYGYYGSYGKYGYYGHYGRYGYGYGYGRYGGYGHYGSYGGYGGYGGYGSSDSSSTDKKRSRSKKKHSDSK
ncbi:MAG: polysaccharide biosynthesis tyrosine autokinase [Clostridia bacterium]|nr:polysaccharide biosynthesis tyrosine autokinase [Clostridia bacterium]